VIGVVRKIGCDCLETADLVFFDKELDSANLMMETDKPPSGVRAPCWRKAAEKATEAKVASQARKRSLLHGTGLNYTRQSPLPGFTVLIKLCNGFQ
jgi:hypothetical protein